MSYSDFTLEAVEQKLGLTTQEADLFPDSPIAPVPEWLPGWLARGTRLALLSEKSRSEFIVVPILLAARELTDDRFAIFSGQRLDIDPGKGLIGECDFILAVGPALPPLHAPLMTVVEAKKNDVEAGLGQCIAQMAGARRFNEAAGRTTTPVYGCVTTGETWQFLGLADQTALLDRSRYYLDNVGRILGVLRRSSSARSRLPDPSDRPFPTGSFRHRRGRRNPSGAGVHTRRRPPWPRSSRPSGRVPTRDVGARRPRRSRSRRRSRRT